MTGTPHPSHLTAVPEPDSARSSFLLKEVFPPYDCKVSAHPGLIPCKGLPVCLLLDPFGVFLILCD